MPLAKLPQGSWAHRVDGKLVAEPADERELIEVVHVLADRGVRLHRDLSLSRARLDRVELVKDRSMTVRAGAGVVLHALDAHLKPHGLTVGPLSPAAMALQLGDFLEGPYAGVRSIPGGRLEPLCTAMAAITTEGRRIETSHAPRSAAGPDLGALLLGAQGRVALITSGVVRCVPLAERDVRLCFDFPTAAAFVAALQRSIAEGFWPWRVHAGVRDGRVLAEVRWASVVGSVERDRDLLNRCVEDAGGRGLGEVEVEAPLSIERECTWDAVRAALEQGRPVQLFRLALSAVVACGEVEGLALDAPSSWNPLGQRLLALDARGVFGGAP